MQMEMLHETYPTFFITSFFWDHIRMMQMLLHTPNFLYIFLLVVTYFGA